MSFVGLFAERDYQKDEVVAEYGGRILSRDEIEGKDQSYFRVFGVSKHEGIIDGKHDFGETLGRYINTPMKRKHPNVRWDKVDEEKKTIILKANKEIKRGTEFTIRYSPPMRAALLAKKKRGRPRGKKNKPISSTYCVANNLAPKYFVSRSKALGTLDPAANQI